MKASQWRLVISSAALKDYQDIVAWTVSQFGAQQARAYAQVIESALQDLREGPEIVGIKWRPELGARIASLHLARKGYKARHLVIVRVETRLASEDPVIEVLRLLHDRMDLQRHLSSTDSE